MATNDIAISALGLSKRFGRHLVLDAIDFEVAAGQSVVFAGANGAGKTTLLRCLASALRPSGGEVRWFGQVAAGRPEMRRLVGMATPGGGLYGQLSLRENLVFAARMFDLAKPHDRVDDLLQRMSLCAHADAMPARLSLGTRQRAVLRGP